VRKLSPPSPQLFRLLDALEEHPEAREQAAQGHRHTRRRHRAAFRVIVPHGHATTSHHELVGLVGTRQDRRVIDEVPIRLVVVGNRRQPPVIATDFEALAIVHRDLFAHAERVDRTSVHTVGGRPSAIVAADLDRSVRGHLLLCDWEVRWTDDDLGTLPGGLVHGGPLSVGSPGIGGDLDRLPLDGRVLLCLRLRGEEGHQREEKNGDVVHFDSYL
jgi:hypothetical protein